MSLSTWWKQRGQRAAARAYAKGVEFATWALETHEYSRAELWARCDNPFDRTPFDRGIQAYLIRTEEMSK